MKNICDSSVSSDMRIVEVKMATTVGRVYVELYFLQNEIYTSY